MQFQSQLTFKVENESVDVSMHGWPRMTGTENLAVLFDNIKSAFGRSTGVRFLYNRTIGDSFLVGRSIGSMSARQFACVKNMLWSDRIGILENQKDDLGELSKVAAQHMIGLLNADGRATILTRRGQRGEFTPVLSVVAAALKADIDRVWSQQADTVQKWIGTETFAGELARWVVEEPGSGSGWSTSR